MPQKKLKFECKGKRRFETKREISDFIIEITMEALQSYPSVKSYKCKYCKGYHLTSAF